MPLNLNHTFGITFDEPTHRYKLVDAPEIELVSCTQFTKRFQREFEKTRMATRKAQTYGCESQEVENLWESVGEEAANIGTITHKMIEAVLINTGEDFLSDHSYTLRERYHAEKHFNTWSNWWKIHGFGYEVIACELPVYSKKYKIAGMVDCLVRDYDTGELIILDWKTNRSWSSGYGKLLSPFDDISDGSTESYSLQQSVYRILLSGHGIETAGAQLVNIPDNTTARAYWALDLRERLIKELEK